MNLIDSLIKEGWLKTPRIITAFKKIKRADFLPEDMKDLAELNKALSIGYGQTISQPLVVAFMLELLQPEEGDRILDVGAGSGWTTALLAYLVSSQGNSKQTPNFNPQTPNGKIIAIEVIPELKEFGEKNIAKYNFLAPHRTRSGAGIEKGIAEFVCADGSRGYQNEAPYDRILCSAAAQKEVPPAWKQQLKIGGRIVMPIGSSIWLFIKKSEFDFDKIEYPGFAFVPLVSGQ